MKSSALTFLLGLSLTLGATVTSRAEDQKTLKLPQGRGQYLEVQAARPTTIALYTTSRARPTKVYIASVSTDELQPVAVTNAHGSSVTLFRHIP